MNKPLLKKYIIGRNAPCPCRSGKKFKRCCYLTLNTDLKDKAYVLYNQKKYDQALIAFRVSLTQYIIWHNEHTVPFVKDRPKEAESLLLIDIEAVYSYINSISWCLEYLRKDEIDTFLEKATDIIDDVRFYIYVATLRAVWLANIHKDKKALQILRPLVTDENIKRIPETDFGLRALEILQDFLFIEISLSCNLLITDKLLDKASAPIDRIANFTKKALIYFAYLDKKTAIILIDKAIEKIKELDIEQIDNASEIFIISRAFRTKSIISKTEEYHLKTIEICQKLATLVKDYEILLSWVYHNISQVYFDLGDFKKTLEYLERAYIIQSSPEVILDFSKVYIRLENNKLASKYLDMIDFSNLTENLRIDYLSRQAEQALLKNDMKLAKELELELSKLDITIPLLREIRDNIRIVLLDMISNKKERRTLLYTLREFISRYFVLQPNIFGIGVNLNEIIAPKEPKE